MELMFKCLLFHVYIDIKFKLWVWQIKYANYRHFNKLKNGNRGFHFQASREQNRILKNVF